MTFGAFLDKQAGEMPLEESEEPFDDDSAR